MTFKTQLFLLKTELLKELEELVYAICLFAQKLPVSYTYILVMYSDALSI